MGLTYTDELYLISSEYQKSRKCDTDYNYYQNSSFGLTLNQIDSTISNFKIDGYICSNCGHTHAEEPMPESCPNCSSENTFKPITNDFVYSKEYYNDNNAQKDYYQKYKNTTGYGEWKAFILNSLIYAEYCADNNVVDNNIKRATFEFKYKWTDSSENFDESILGTVLWEASNALYYLNIEHAGDALGDSSVYTIKDTSAQTTTVVYIVEKRV